ncbi:thioredoxin family protein [Aquimarina aquimarini]|uniref:thioredoxin family protein n=1 Tax=Aquimarina aquimarini TaxID=1191734 RepID=UPI000D54EFA0|nr:thioredoxin family protein [Aquimarina aquimarini]
MKRIILLSLLVLSSNHIFSQGIDFEHSNWDEIKAKAKTEKKLIFVDVYTDWCAPCKKMSKEVFPIKELGDYYNPRFVSVKIDAEKGEGIALAKKYGVISYPTFLFLDATGKLLHITSAYADKDAMIELAKTAQNPKKRFTVLDDEFNKGNRDKDFIKKYLSQLIKLGGETDNKLGIYLNSLPQKEVFTKHTYELIHKYAFNIKSIPFEILINNFDSFSKIIPEKKLINKISKRYILTQSHHVGAGFAEKYVDTTVIPFLRTTNYPYKDKLIAQIEINYLKNCQKYKEAIDRIIPFLEQYASDDFDLIMDHIGIANYSPIDLKSDTLKEFITWSNKTILIRPQNMDAHIMNMKLNLTSKNYNQAIKQAVIVVDLGNKSDDPLKKLHAYFMAAKTYSQANDKSTALKLAKKSQAICTKHKEKINSYYLNSVDELIKKLSS